MPAMKPMSAPHSGPAAMPAAIGEQQQDVARRGRARASPRSSDSCSSSAIDDHEGESHERAASSAVGSHSTTFTKLEVVEVGRGVDGDVELQRAGGMARPCARCPTGMPGGIEAALEPARDHDAVRRCTLLSRVDAGRASSGRSGPCPSRCRRRPRVGTDTPTANVGIGERAGPPTGCPVTPHDVADEARRR